MQSAARTKKKFRVPHVYVMILCLLILAALLTYVIPAGQYTYITDEATGRRVVDPDSFQYVEQNPTGIVTFVTAIPAGMAAQVDVIMLIVLVIGAFEIINATGALNAGIFAVIRRLKGRESFVIAAMTVLFSVMGGFLGWAEGLLMFIPLAVSITLAMGYDSVLGVAVVLIGGVAGFTAGPLNLYTTGVCQGIAGIELFSGLWFRVAAWAIFTAVATVSLVLYARRIKADPTRSAVYGVELALDPVDESALPAFTTRMKIIAALVILSFIGIAYGSTKLGWYLKEITGFFIMLGIVCGFIGRLSLDDMCAAFAKGVRMIIPAALVIGMARGILYIMEQALILDTIVHALVTAIDGLPTVLSAIFIDIMALFMDFFIGSASGKAAMLMPILMPVGDIIGVSRQVITVAYQFGDGFGNVFYPTSGLVMAGLAMGGNIPYAKWMRFYLKLFLVLMAAGLVLVAAAQLMGLQ